MTPSEKASRLEVENDDLRRQLEKLRSNLVYASFGEAPASRRAPRRKPHLPITSAMNHDQMVREAKLRGLHNKQRQQLKGYLRIAAGRGEQVNTDDLHLAAKLAKMSVPPAILER